ncbi:enhanced serine sensitivity protein SseB [Escherichia coli]|nr:enhanced serine sensitivity protein SseB [Escherichia coli]
MNCGSYVRNKNELEDLLEKAATEPAHRPAFSVLYWNPPSGCLVRRRRARLWLKIVRLIYSTGKRRRHQRHSFFTSLEALQQAVEDEQAFVVMPVRTLFEMTLGETLFLNAKLPTGKEFMPREISLLIGEEGNPLSSQEILEGGESLILSEVAEPPAQMIDSLTTLFKTIKSVKRAFICSIKENEEAQPNLLIGIEADGDIEEIIQATGSVATDTLPGDEPIDICQVKKGKKELATLLPNILCHSMNVAGVVFA